MKKRLLWLIPLFLGVAVTAKAGCGRCMTCNDWRTAAEAACVADGGELVYFNCDTILSGPQAGCGLYFSHRCSHGGNPTSPDLTVGQTETCDGN